MNAVNLIDILTPIKVYNSSASFNNNNFNVLVLLYRILDEEMPVYDGHEIPFNAFSVKSFFHYSRIYTINLKTHQFQRTCIQLHRKEFTIQRVTFLKLRNIHKVFFNHCMIKNCEIFIYFTYLQIISSRLLILQRHIRIIC